MGQDPYRFFRIEAAELAEELSRGVLSLESGSASEHVPRLLRAAHTLKGAARVVKHRGIAELAHALEDVLAGYRDRPEVPARDVIDQLLSMVDQIAKLVRELSPAAPPLEATPVSGGVPAALPNPATAAPEESPVVAAGAGELDELVQGISEVSVQLRAVRASAAVLERMQHLAVLLTTQINGALPEGAPASVRGSALSKARSIAAELAELAQKAERAVAGSLDQTDRELSEVRGAAERLRLLPAAAMCGALERTARDASLELGKRVRFSMSGGEVRVDAQTLSVVRAALVQAVRNAVAHGIEPSRERASAGKPAEGSVEVRVLRRGSRVSFSCRDDGRGIDLDGIRLAAERAGVLSPGGSVTDAASLVKLLLKGGISTARTVTQTAGRGIGLDVAREAAARLGGELSLTTDRERGTVLELVVPLSLSSVEALLVEAGGIQAAIPLEAVVGAVRLKDGEVMRTQEGESIVFDGSVIPFQPLARSLSRKPSGARRPPAFPAVVVRGAAGVAALGVDRLVGTSRVVMRSLPSLAPTDPVVLGASLDVDGMPQLVLDPEALVAASSGSRGLLPERAAEQRLPVLVVDDSLTTRMLERSILESAGYEVEVAASAEEALEKLPQRRFGLFLVDVEMPGMDGFEFVARTRTHPQQPGVPAILVSSRNAPEDFERGRLVGASAYVVKAEFDQRKLLETIRELVSA